MAAYAPEQMADRAMELCDVNKDGFIDSQEALKAPSIAEGFAILDKDHDKRVSRDELLAPLEEFAKGNVALFEVMAVVTRGGQPVSEVTVTLTPEPFMAQSLKPATGKTDGLGLAGFQTEGAGFPGVQPGFFRVQASQTDPGGKEKLPAKYNSQSTLGWFATPARRGRIEIKLD